MNKCRICWKEIWPKYTDKVLRCSKCRKEVDYAIEEIKEENRKLKKYYDRDKEELMESCYWLARENDELKKKLNDIQEAYIRFEKLDSQFQKWLGELDQLIMNR
jgi:flagellar motility protein MotE (MotC chaperone)